MKVALLALALAACAASAGPPAPPELVTITLGPTDAPALDPQATVQLTATGTYSDTTTRDVTSLVTWTSDMAGVAMIDASGLVTGVAEGTAHVTATSGSITGSEIVAVTNGGVASVVIMTAHPSLAKGQTTQLTAVVTNKDGSHPNAMPMWTTSDPSVGIDNTGYVTAVAIGASDITATQGGMTSAPTTITVTAAELTSLAIGPASPHVALGFTTQLTANGDYTDGTQVDPATVVWTSDQPAVATIATTGATDGVVTPVTAGMATIHAQVGTMTAMTTIVVTAATLVSIAVTPNPANVVPTGTVALTATGTFSDATTLDITQNTTWATTANATVTTTGTRGVVTGVAVGDATITATDGAAMTTSLVHVLGLAVAAIAPSDGAIGVRATTPIAIAFDQPVQPVSLTAQAATGACTGSIQVSADHFATCAGGALVVASPTATFTPAAALTPLATYQVRVLGTAANAAGVAMGTDVTQPNGFTIATDGTCASTIVISQVYGAGGNTGASYDADYVELHNAGPTTESIGGWSVQYAAAASASWAVVALPQVSIPPGRYFLIQMSAKGPNGIDLPQVDLAALPTVAMGASAGKLALVSSTTALTTACPVATTLDFVGYGTGTSGANCFEGTAPAATPSATKSDLRGVAGCTDANDNTSDFATALAAPRSSATPIDVCSCVANETDKVTELDYCDLQFPATLALAPNATSLVYGRVYEAGLTEGAGPSPAIRMELGIGAAAGDPRVDAFTWQATTYNMQIGNNDEYQATLVAPATASTYRYTTRATRDGTNWTYCDLDGAGANAGLAFDPAQQGVLTDQ
ncbi:MAG: Ig-like domain-containing protein [Kofleriaceae bacterium]